MTVPENVGIEFNVPISLEIVEPVAIVKYALLVITPLVRVNVPATETAPPNVMPAGLDIVKLFSPAVIAGSVVACIPEKVILEELPPVIVPVP